MACSVLLHLILLTASASAFPGTKPGCQKSCGEVSIPYPFGVGNDTNCFRDSEFQLVCNISYHPPVLMYGDFPVLNISLLSGEMTLQTKISEDCYYENGKNSADDSSIKTLSDAFRFSYTRNKFTAIGCDTIAFMSDTELATIFGSGCISWCLNTENGERSCDGKGCCQTEIPKNLETFYMSLDSFSNYTNSRWKYTRCSYAFLADKEWFKFLESDIWNFSKRIESNFDKVPRTQVVVDWAIRNQSCKEAQKVDPASYACKENSHCSDSSNGPGYLCYCKYGYQGNPYLPGGCQDINECINNPCKGLCTNTPGSYNCSCPPGTHANGTTDCISSSGKKIPMERLMLGISLVLLFLVIASSWMYWGMQKRKLTELKRKFFQQNGGLLLQQKLSSHECSLERTKIFTSEELKAATNNYEESRIIGQGGYGVVYKGILPDNKVIAIKKAKVIESSQIDQFINEVLILSQINHRNVVKLLGCCLETELPLLVYEFISNGTLFEHIHDEQYKCSVSWANRLRIASETAGALAYLHSAASPPIIHRDVKSANILLDENNIAKVSDFGASRLVPLDQVQLTTLIQGTLGYLDPEYLLTSQLTEKSDVYSFGVILVELLTGMKALSFDRPEEERNLAMYFVSSMKENRMMEILEDRVAHEGNIEQLREVARLAKRCLQLNGDERPTMKEVAMELEGLRRLQMHPWIEQNPEETEYLLGDPSKSSINGGTECDDSLRNEVILSLEGGR
ncbi:PREDICTED: putative wall-associated receptor kinase-like 16 [Nelumbo nucifera]|uniref:Wall-associated receptor kinase-like 16 n=2 Tax=Nelumbo nucifera TaxID=4432 RepID=A0A822Z8B9_NELNU|nr:PREDICTED: putative wall-associated receptor kinase-like 16 [Nelumbo nucifera]DAD39286.1 TPA_asm: hypothetical protein HUJ06_013609 [Nelumbo nucifera]